MLVRNLRKAGDYERAILSQDENLRMSIANDRAVSQAVAQSRMGMMPELTPQQQMSKQEELTDAIAIQAKAQENLLTLYPKETVSKFMAGLSKDNMIYLNVYWNDLKPVFKNKTGLTKTYFDRILTQHIQTITDSRGMSTRQSQGWDNASLNELDELNQTGIKFLVTTSIINDLIKELKIKKIRTTDLQAFQEILPTPLMLKKASELSDAQKQTFFADLIKALRGMFNPDENTWKNALLEPKKVEQLFTPVTVAKMRELQKIYSVIGGRPT
jgi:hypothetical protein